MTGWIESFYYFIIGAAMLLTVMGLWFTVIMPCLDRWSRRFFIAYFSVLLLCCVVSLTDLIIARYPDTEAALTVLGFLETLSLSVTIPMLTAYLVRSCGGNVWGSGLFRAMMALWSVFFILLASTLFTKHMYYVAPDRQFQRGPWFPLLMLPLIVIMLLNLAAAVRARRKLSRKYYFGFLTAILPLTVTLPVHAFTDVTALIDISTVLSAISMLGLILSDQTERYVEKERENARLRTDIMLSQIQPHFLYNTLGTIGRLYRNDPEAKAALIKFSDYLRGNMDSLSQTEPLPFTTELKHTKTYLELEQLRFRDKLTVCYDLEPTDFLLPVLTLQPLVENAVRHGVRGNDTGAGTVTVATREYPDRYEISVTDDGPGFDPDAEPEGDGAHIGIRNVRDRMRRFVGGDLKIETAPGRGCRATILMPKEIRYADLRH